MTNKEQKINLLSELKIDKQLEKIWSERYENKEILSGIFPNELYSNSITFLSLNPSLQPKDRLNTKKGNYPENPYPIVDWKRTNAEYKFFKKFYDLGKEFKPWTILDLLYERDSNQKNLEQKYKRKTILKEDKAFLENQIKLTFEILKSINPKIVIISNSFANKLIHENFKELNLTQEIPSVENNYIYRINGIPFITNESKFMGSRFLEQNNDRINKLSNEIRRIITEIEK